MTLTEKLAILEAQRQHDAEFERLDALLKDRDDLRVLVVAAVLCGRKGEIQRSYVLEKLATSDTEFPQGCSTPIAFGSSFGPSRRTLALRSRGWQSRPAWVTGRAASLPTLRLIPTIRQTCLVLSTGHPLIHLPIQAIRRS